MVNLRILRRGEIEVLSRDWSVSQTSNMHSGSGGGAGKATVHHLHFEHYIDKASPNLLQYCLSGKHIPESVLTIRKAGGSPLKYLRIILQELINQSMSIFVYASLPGALRIAEVNFHSRAAAEFQMPGQPHPMSVITGVQVASSEIFL